IGSAAPANTDWFVDYTTNQPLGKNFLFPQGALPAAIGSWVTAIAPTVNTTVTLTAPAATIIGRGSNLTTGPITPIGATAVDSQTNGAVPNCALAWQSYSKSLPSPLPATYNLVANLEIYAFWGSPGATYVEQCYSAPVPKAVYFQILTTKTVNTATANTNDFLTYTMTYSNTGTNTLNNVTVWDTVPANTSYVPGSATPAASLSGSLLTWAIGTLNPGV